MEQKFITGLRLRRHDSQTAFVKKYGPQVHAFIFNTVGNRCDADELTADVFVKALTAIDNYDESKSSLATWLHRIAHNVAVSHMRRPRMLFHSLEADNDLAETESEENPRLELLKVAIARLKYDDRVLLHMYYFENASLAEIAFVLGVKEGALTVRLHRIRVRLKKMIEENER